MIREKITWAFIRGLGHGVGHWVDFQKLFQQQFPEDQLCFVDLPGNGENHLLQSPFHISEYTDFLRPKVLDQRTGGKLNLVAISLGGMIATNWMCRFPGEIHQAFLINTSAANFSFPTYRLQLHELLKLAYERYVIKSEFGQLAISYNNSSRFHQFAKELSEYETQFPVSPSNMIKQIAAGALFQFPETAPGRVTLFASLHDRLVNFHCSQQIAKKWKIPLLVHPEAGHDMTFDEPQWMIENISQSLYL